MAFFDRKEKETQKEKSPQNQDAEIDALIRSLGSHSWETRGSAAIRLNEIGQPALVQLFKALDSPNSLIQSGAAEVLATYGEPAIPTLLKIAFSGTERARDGAARAIGQNGDRALPQLKEALADKEDMHKCCGALLCLGYMGYLGEEVENLLVTFLYNSNVKVRKRAATSLEAINWKPKSKAHMAQFYIAKGDYGSLAKLGNDALPSIKNEIINGNPELRQNVAEVLPKIASEEAIVILLKLCEDEDAQVRQKTIVAMGDCNDRRLLPYIVKSLEDPDSYVRMETAWTLDKIGWKPSNNTEKGRYLIIKEKWTELLKMRDAAIPLLIETLADKNPGIRMKSTEILRAMGNIGYAAINEALKSEDPILRSGAQEAVVLIKKKNANAAAKMSESRDKKETTPDEEVEEQIKRQKETMKAKGDAAYAEEKWADFMRRNGLDEERITKFSKALSDPNEIIRAAAIESLKSTGACGIECMIVLLKDKKNNVRVAAIESLGDLSALKAAPYLVKILKDPNENIRTASIHSLGLIREPKTLKFIIPLLSDQSKNVKNEASATIAKFGSAALTYLQNSALDSDVSLRILSIKTIAKISDNLSIQICIRMLNDSEYDVRDCAENAIITLSDTLFNRIIDESFRISKRGTPLEKTGLISVLNQLNDSRATQAIGFFADDPNPTIHKFAKEILKDSVPNPEELERLKETISKSQAQQAATAKKSSALSSSASSAKNEQGKTGIGANSLQKLGSETDTETESESDVPIPVEEVESKEEKEARETEEICKVIEKLKGTDTQAQMEAAEKIYTYGQKAVMPLLRSLEKESDHDLRTFLAEILIGMGDEAINGLLSILQSSEPALRITAAQTLGKIPDDRTIIALCELLDKDNNSMVRKVAAESLGFMGDKRAIQPLVNAVNDHDKALKSASLRSLGYLADQSVIPILLQNVNDRDTDTARAAIEAILQYGGEAVEPLEKALITEKGTLREKITYVLDELNWVPENETTITYYMIARKQWSEIESIGEGAIPPLVETVKEPSIEIKIAAMNTIANIGGEKAVEALEGIIDKTEDTTEKTLAITMLKKARSSIK